MIDISQITQRMFALGVAKEGDLIGVAMQEVLDLEQRLGLALPHNYKQFLLAMGRSAGFLSPWMAIYYDDLQEIREQFDYLNATLATPATLPANALIIANWESVFDFMVCTNEDPEIMRVDLCNKSGPRMKTYASSYSAYLDNLINNSDPQEIPADLLEDQEAYTQELAI